MDTPVVFNEKIIALQIQANDSTEVIRQLGALLQAEGYVKNTFIESAIEREKVFATGLPLGKVNVALPHTDAEHVLHPAIALGSLREPVEFHVMGSPDDLIQVQLVFLMAIQQDQVKMLQVLCDTFKDSSFLDDLLGARSKQEAITILNARFHKQE